MTSDPRRFIGCKILKVMSRHPTLKIGTSISSLNCAHRWRMGLIILYRCTTINTSLLNSFFCVNISRWNIICNRRITLREERKIFNFLIRNSQKFKTSCLQGTLCLIIHINLYIKKKKCYRFPLAH